MGYWNVLGPLHDLGREWFTQGADGQGEAEAWEEQPKDEQPVLDGLPQPRYDA